jgi:hypothetical protein
LTRWIAILSLLLLTTACGRGLTPAALTSPPAGSPAPASTATASPTPTASPAPSLVLTGAVTANATPGVAGVCGRVKDSYGVDLRFPVGGRPFQATITILAYTGPGAYAAPPNRVGVHTVGQDNPVLFAGTHATIDVAPDERSGTVKATLTGDSGTVQLSGGWVCPRT